MKEDIARINLGTVGAGTASTFSSLPSASGKTSYLDKIDFNYSSQPYVSGKTNYADALNFDTRSAFNDAIAEKSVYGPTVEKAELITNPNYSGDSAILGWNNIDSTKRDWFKSQGYTADSFNENITGANAAYEQAHKGTDWGMQGYGGLALGVGQLGLGLASYFDQRGIAKKQKELLGQQIANNRTEMAATAKYRDALAENFT